MRLRHSDDEGSILIAVVGIMVVLSVLAIGAYSMADNNLLQTKLERNRAQSLAVAEAGLQQVLWRIKQRVPPTSGVAVSIDVTGTGTAEVMPTLSGSTWKVVSVGRTTQMPNITRTLTAKAISMSIYDMFYADGPVNPGSNGRINGSGEFHGSAYMRGDWPDSNGSAVFLDGPFFAKDGDVVLSGNARMGDPPPATPVELYSNGYVDTSHVYANIYTSVPDLPMPQQTPNDISTLRTKANDESRDNFQGTRRISGNVTNDEFTRTSGEATGMPNPLKAPYADKTYSALSSTDRQYKVVDDNIYSDGSVGTVYIGKSAAGVVLPSFGRPFDPNIGKSTDDFAWDAAQGVLTVQGTVYIDAQHVVITDVKWAGKGTIVTYGDVTINGLYEPAVRTIPFQGQVRTDPADPWGYPKMHVLGISANGAILENSPDGYGVFYSSTSWSMNPSGNYDTFHGEIVAPEITLGKHAKVWTTPGMGAALPPSLPGGQGQFLAITGWHEGVN